METEAEEDLAMQRLSIYKHGPAEPTPEPPNGKRWWKETWGKAVGSVLGTLMLLVLYWVGGRALVLKAATTRVYETPARVDKIEDRLNTQAGRAIAPTLTSTDVENLRAFLEAHAPKKPKP